MTKEKLCMSCQKLFDLENNKYVLLGTYDGEKVMDESYFHFECWIKYYNSQVETKVKNTLKGATQKVAGMMKGMIPAMQQGIYLGSSISGEDQVFDVSAEIPDMNTELPELKSLTEILHPKKEEKKKCKKKK